MEVTGASRGTTGMPIFLYVLIAIGIIIALFLIVRKMKMIELFKKILETKKSKAIFFSVIVITAITAIICIIVFFCKSPIIGKWENEQYNIEFTEKGFFFADDNKFSGEYEIDGKEIVLIYSEGELQKMEFKVDGNCLTLTFHYPNGEVDSRTLFRTDS